MTQDELERLEALANAATPGPWLYRGKSDSVHQAPWGPYQYGDQVFRFNDEEAPSDADREFILAARDAVPALVAEVKRLRGLVEAAYREGHLAGGDRATDFYEVPDEEADWALSTARKALEGA